MDDPQQGTTGDDYTARLRQQTSARWKRWLHVQAPYRWNLRRLEPGFTLDVGCGIGRNLLHLDGSGIGVDHNPASVAEARRRGCVAFVPSDFERSQFAVPNRFDSLLFAHVLEHMAKADAVHLVGSYLQYLKSSGKVIAIVPQEAGFDSDPTHVDFLDLADLARIIEHHDLEVERAYSFPLPRLAGRWFRHNESVVVGIKT